MSYYLEYEGAFLFNMELKASDLSFINSFLKEDIRNHPEWGAESHFLLDKDSAYSLLSSGPNYKFKYFNLKFTDNFDGLEWDGTENAYALESQINFIIEQMRKKYPNFGVTGEMHYHCDDFDEESYLVVGGDGYIALQETPSKKKELKFPTLSNLENRRVGLNKLIGKNVIVRSLGSARPENTDVNIYVPIPEYNIALWYFSDKELDGLKSSPLVRAEPKSVFFGSNN